MDDRGQTGRDGGPVTVAEVVRRWSVDSAPDREVVVMPAAEELIRRLPGAVPWADDAPTDRPRLVVEASTTDHTTDALVGLSRRLGAQDVAVLLLPFAPADLPLPLLVTVLLGLELQVREAEPGETGLGRTVLVVAPATHLPPRSDLHGAAGDADDARRHREIEWTFESLQLRASIASERARAQGSAAEAVAVRALLEEVQQRLAAARRELLDEREANRSRWERLRTRASADARKAADLISANPAVGVSRIARSAVRRLKH